MMAGRGPAPKPADERARRNVDPAPTTMVEPDDELRGPDLPKCPGFLIGFGEDAWVEHEWPAATLTWWENWRRAPQAQAFTATDWDVLAETAVLHGEFWSGNRKVAAELRLRAAQFGATVADRARLRMQVGKPAGNTEPAKPKPAPAEDRDAQILRLVQDAG